MAETMFSAVLDAVPMAVLRLEDRDRILTANSAAEALFGLRIAGRRLSDVLRHPAIHERLADCLARGGAGHLRTALATRAGQRQFEVHITPLAPDGAVVAFEDQTALDQARLMRRDFVANVSHELRTPLTALVGFIETLRGAARDDATARDRFLGIMEREAGRMIRLVNDLLSLSRVEAEEHRRPPDIVDLAGLIRNVIQTQRDQAGAAGVEIVFGAGEGPFNVRGDADQLTQVVHNLTENAVKYGGSGGLVTLSLTRIGREPKLQGPAVMVAVADRGEGIDPLHLPRLTERFYRVDTHRSREKGGTGLGLAIVKHIVNRHRGRLKIESEPGKGSRFIVVLPEA